MSEDRYSRKVNKNAMYPCLIGINSSSNDCTSSEEINNIREEIKSLENNITNNVVEWIKTNEGIQDIGSIKELVDKYEDLKNEIEKIKDDGNSEDIDSIQDLVNAYMLMNEVMTALSKKIESLEKNFSYDSDSGEKGGALITGTIGDKYFENKTTLDILQEIIGDEEVWREEQLPSTKI